MRNPYAALRASLGRPLFIPFTVLGDPNPEDSQRVVEALVAGGADALELGFPFSDPPADGPVIQAADVRALAAGTRVDDCFDIIRSVRGRHALPIGLLVYFNLVLQRGIGRFYADCKAAGVDSVLIADLPLEHMDEVAGAARANNIAPVQIVSELTTDERLRRIAGVAGGYLYLVSYLGVTGEEDAVFEEKTARLIKRIRAVTDLPLCVGFGINSPGQVRSVVSAGADGVIIGSRIVREVPDCSAIERICIAMKAALPS